MQEFVYIVQDTCPRHQRLDAAHQWHKGKISQNVIDEAVGQWTKRSRASMKANKT